MLRRGSNRDLAELRRNCDYFNHDKIEFFESPDIDTHILDPMGISIDKMPNVHLLQRPAILTRDEEYQHFVTYHYIRFLLHRAFSSPDTDKERLAILAAHYYTMRERLILCNCALIKTFASQYSSKTSVSFDILKTAGEDTLLKCVEGYDPWLGRKFSTYFCRSMIRAFQSQIIKINRQNQFKPLNESGYNLSECLGCRDLNYEEDQSQIFIKMMSVLSLAKRQMSDEEKMIIFLRFNFADRERSQCLTYQEIADFLQITEERVRKLYKKSMRIIRIHAAYDKEFREMAISYFRHSIVRVGRPLYQTVPAEQPLLERDSLVQQFE